MSGLERPLGPEHAGSKGSPVLPVLDLDAIDDAIAEAAPVRVAQAPISEPISQKSRPRRSPIGAKSLWARVATSVRSVSARLGRGSRWVSLRRVPVVVAIATALITFPMARWLESRWTRAEQQRVWSWAERDVANAAAKAVAMVAGGPKPNDGGSWLVYPADHRVESLGETDIEPPLFQFAAAAKDDVVEENFQQRGRTFLSYTRPVDGKVWVVSIVDLNWYWGTQRRYASGIRRSVLLAWLLSAALVGLCARFLTRPARNTLRERADFLADAAHEMRTPLAVIQASAGHALSRPRDTEGYVRSLTEIRTAAERAASGVTELLDLARFDAGQAVPRLAPLRLDLLGEEIVAATRVDACNLRVEVGPSVLVEADMSLLRQAIDNLVRNAAARSSNVVLSCAIDGRDGLLRVSDDGPGFAAEQLPYVFERYRRGDGRGSLGLGLPIAASIVASHGGRVEIVSPATEGVGDTMQVGSTVTVRLPRSRVLG